MCYSSKLFFVGIRMTLCLHYKFSVVTCLWLHAVQSRGIQGVNRTLRKSTRLHPPSPYLSVCWKACTSLRVSSTERPTGRSLMVICLKMPLSSITNRPLWSRTRGENLLLVQQSVYNKICMMTVKLVFNIIGMFQVQFKLSTKHLLHNVDD